MLENINIYALNEMRQLFIVLIESKLKKQNACEYNFIGSNFNFFN